MRRHRARKFFTLLFIGAGLALTLIDYAAFAIRKDSIKNLFVNVSEVPHTRVALLLGCAPTLGRGFANPYFVNRMDAAGRLFKAGKADYFLVSGDNHRAGYDEPTAMRNALVERGVPENRIVLDYAGFSTSDSVLRAKAVFGLTDLCVVTQRDHAMRALYIAHQHRMKAIAFAADDIPLRYGWRTSLRETLARARTILDVNVWGRPPHFGGPPVSIPSSGES